MIYNKKSKKAGSTRDKLSIIQSALEEIKKNRLNFEIWKEESKTAIVELDLGRPFTSQEEKANRWYNKGKYFTNKEKDIIIDYLLECLVNDEVFDYSTLGPNRYLNKDESNISNVSDTKL